MGIWTDVFTAPVEPILPPVDVFGRLVLDLARERVVRTPWTLLAGTLCVNACVNWGSVSGAARFERPAVGTLLRTEQLPEDLRCDDPPPWGDSHEEARVLARGDAVLDVLPALRAAPYGIEDIAVVFSHLDFGNRAVADYLRYEDPRTTVVCYALASPQHRPLATHDCGEPGGPTHPVRTCVVHTFKHADHDGLVAPIASVVARHLGPDLVTGETWG